MSKGKITAFCKYLGHINGNVWRSLVSVFKKYKTSARRNNGKLALQPFYGSGNSLLSSAQYAMQRPKIEPFILRVFPKFNAKLEPTWNVIANAFVALPPPGGCFLVPKTSRGSTSRMASTTGSSRMKNSMMQNKSGMVITLDTSGFTKENITVEVEGNWLIVEALATSAQPGKGGYLQRHMMRRFELRPQSDVANITIELNERANRLIVKVPRKKPQQSSMSVDSDQIVTIPRRINSRTSGKTLDNTQTLNRFNASTYPEARASFSNCDFRKIRSNCRVMTQKAVPEANSAPISGDG
ncbi:unnamed protein product [Nesidiocoris tenuis]|uniref:SHSP domain-containing protein n=1 Tax=Nesidiocoris tenuis TaxID=355587 RepID=A0A6H5H3G7_9HEMI|nr:unnamed protein product [Nesidiocoris tenuis]